MANKEYVISNYEPTFIMYLSPDNLRDLKDILKLTELQKPTRFENRTSKFNFIRVMALLLKIRVDPGGGHFIASFFRLLVFYLTVRASRHFFFCFVAKKLRSTRNAMTDLGSFSVGMHEILFFLCMTRSIIFVCCRIIQNNTVEFNVCLN